MGADQKFKNMLQRRWVKILLIVTGSFILIAASAALIDYAYYYSRTYPRVLLESIDVGHMRMEEVEAFLESGIWSMDRITVALPDNEKHALTLAELGLAWDKSATLEQIYRAGRGWEGYRLRVNSLINKTPLVVSGVVHVNEEKLGEAMTKLARAVYRPPHDAAFEVQGDSVTITPEQKGRYLKVGALRRALLGALYSNAHELTAPIGDWPAARTASVLESYGVQQEMASFYTDVAAGNPDRAHNIKLGSAAINGTLLAPGETLSFSELVGRVTPEKGYRYAPIIVGDELVPGLGGGLCQVSTTLYNAALYANLEIAERHNHSMTISYIPLGRDATVAIGSLDLKLRNNRDHFILVGAELSNLRLTFRIFGPPMDETVEIVSTGYQQVAPPVRYEYTDALPAGVTELLKAGRPGYYITTWRVVTLNNREIGREMLARDYYVPTPAVYRVGTGQDY